MVLAPWTTARAQRLSARELSAGVLGTVADADFWGGALGFGIRPGGQFRFTATAAVGDLEGRTAGRGEVTAQLVLTPPARRGAGVYAGGGVAWPGVEGSSGAGYLVLLLGLESTPGRHWGWYIETGVAGGVRVAAGLRRRWFPPWW